MIDKSGYDSGNIKLEQYTSIVGQAKTACLEDLVTTVYTPDKPISSVLTVKLGWRDDEDASWVDDGYFQYVFTQFEPHLMAFMKDRSETIQSGFADDETPLKDRVYWKVKKYIQFGSAMVEMYEAFFSLDLELLGVFWDCDIDISQKNTIPEYSKFRRSPEKMLPLSEAQKYLMESSHQLKNPWNVELPFAPGDILYINTNPISRPILAVYGAETDAEQDHFLWTVENFGYYKRTHPCLYRSHERDDITSSNLTDFLLFDEMFYPHAPLDRITEVEHCADVQLMKISALLREDPDNIHRWINSKR